jgi:protein ImuB
MKRFASVWLPAWPIERMRRGDPAAVPDDRPFALAEPGARGILITAVNARARAAGIRPGQSLADARAIFPALLTRRAERARDRAALVRLARWSARYGPARNSEGEDGLWIDVTGVAHLFGGEDRLMADLVARLGAFGLTARAALADTAVAAAALARFGNPGASRFLVAPPGATRQALASLPVEALGLDDDSVVLLKRLGLRRIGQLYDIPRAALARRFRDLGRSGKKRAPDSLAGAVLGRLDLALGLAPEARPALTETPSFLARRIFAEPLISAEGLKSAVAELAGGLCRELDQAAAGARRLRLSLYRVDGTVAEVRAGLSKPSRDPRHLLRLLSEKMSAIDAGFGIDALVLEAIGVEPLDAVQEALTAGLGPDPCADAASLVDRLANRLGPKRVLRLVPRESHIPERAEARVPALDVRQGKPERSAPSGAPSPLPKAARPPLLFASPEPITVMAEVPEGPPAWFTWRRVHHVVAKAEGPERIEPEWWRILGPAARRQESLRPRDYYRIEDDRGGRFWVFREGLYGREAETGPPLWYIHGLFG